MGSAGAMMGMKLPDTFYDVECGSVTGLVNDQQSAAMTVLAHDIGLRRKPIADAPYIVQIKRRSIHGLQGQIGNPGIVSGLEFIIDVVFVGAKLGGSCGDNQVLRREGTHYICAETPFDCINEGLDRP